MRFFGVGALRIGGGSDRGCGVLERRHPAGRQATPHALEEARDHRIATVRAAATAAATAATR